MIYRCPLSVGEYPLALKALELSFPRPIIPPKGYPMEPLTLGEHIRKRRLDLELLQVEVAAEIGVTESTVRNWEHGTEPELRYIPAVIAFLEALPCLPFPSRRGRREG
ncbi:MAG: helix-turn-helix domain-containing protein [Nitrospirae bacterium]|nr:helix-turn-helix domain-containing protein [Nitrospirota bacterium]